MRSTRPLSIARVSLVGEAPPGLPVDLDQVILRCLAKRPGDRFSDAPSMERALGSCASAGEWSRERAAHWWRNLPDRPAGPPSGVPPGDEFDARPSW